MKIPKRLNIFSTMYDVVVVDKLNDVDVDGEKYLWGSILYDDCEIRIYKAKDNSARDVQTLFHEIIHAIMNKTTIEKYISEKYREDFIDVLATGLFDTLERNGLLADGHCEAKTDS